MKIDYIQYEMHYHEFYGKLPALKEDTYVEYFLDHDRSCWHRVGGPAFISRNERSYWIYGDKHRLNAPAQYDKYRDIMNWYEFGVFIKDEKWK